MPRPPLVLAALLAAGCRHPAQIGLAQTNPGLGSPFDSALTDTAGDTAHPADTAPAEPEPTSESLVGRAYTLDPLSWEVTRPAALGDLLRGALDRDILVYVADETNDTLTLTATIAGATGAQNPCEDVVPFGLARWSNPRFVAGPGDLPAAFQGAHVLLHESRFDVTVDPTATSWLAGTLSAKLDLRDVSGLVGSDDDHVCDWVATYGGDCDLCADGGEYCVAFDVDDVLGTQLLTPFDPAPDSGAC